MEMTEKSSYFLRMIFLDEDEDKDYLTPTYIRIPLQLACPEEDVLRLLVFLEQYYGADCYLVFSEMVDEGDAESIKFEVQGVMSNIVLIVTSWVEDEEVITGLITPLGEFEPVSFERDLSSILLLKVDEKLVETLGLEYCDEAYWPHREYLKSIGEYDADDTVYLPHALYA